MPYLKIQHLLLLMCGFVLLSCEEGELNGTKTVYFPDSEQIKQSVDYVNGRKTGKWLEYFRMGYLKAEQRYLNDTLHDSSFFYYDNGKIASLQIFEKGVKKGRWKKYNKKGQLIWDAGLEKNQFEGKFYKYSYRNLRLIENFNFKHGEKDGKQESFYNNGKPCSVSYYKEGQELPGTEEWEENGKKINNDFKIFIDEQNEVLLKNKLTYIIRLENPKPSDKLYSIIKFDDNTDDMVYSPIKKVKDYFIIEFDIEKRGFIMKDIKLRAERKTALGNTVFKSSSFIASANNF